MVVHAYFIKHMWTAKNWNQSAHPRSLIRALTCSYTSCIITMKFTGTNTKVLASLRGFKQPSKPAQTRWLVGIVPGRKYSKPESSHSTVYVNICSRKFYLFMSPSKCEGGHMVGELVSVRWCRRPCLRWHRCRGDKFRNPRDLLNLMMEFHQICLDVSLGEA